jgi:hypothetical protein
MTDLDALLQDVPIAAPSLTGAVGRPKKCRRHEWVKTYRVTGDCDVIWEVTCAKCPAIRDEARSRRGRNARKRGNGLQAKAAKAAGIANIGALGLPEDAGTSREWIRLQVKSGAGYPRLLDRWLRAITVDADQLRGVVYVETPGAGHRAKRLIVLDYDEFLAWYGK